MQTLAIYTPGPWEMAALLVLGLLLFGKRLPEVGRSIGKGIVEFKRGLKDIGDEIETESNRSAPPPRRIPEDEHRRDEGARLDPPAHEGVSRADPVD